MVSTRSNKATHTETPGTPKKVAGDATTTALTLAPYAKHVTQGSMKIKGIAEDESANVITMTSPLRSFAELEQDDYSMAEDISEDFPAKINTTERYKGNLRIHLVTSVPRAGDTEKKAKSNNLATGTVETGRRNMRIILRCPPSSESGDKDTKDYLVANTRLTTEQFQGLQYDEYLSETESIGKLSITADASATSTAGDSSNSTRVTRKKLKHAAALLNNVTTRRKPGRPPKVIAIEEATDANTAVAESRKKITKAIHTAVDSNDATQTPPSTVSTRKSERLSKNMNNKKTTGRTTKTAQIQGKVPKAVDTAVTFDHAAETSSSAAPKRKKALYDTSSESESELIPASPKSPNHRSPRKTRAYLKSIGKDLKDKSVSTSTSDNLRPKHFKSVDDRPIGPKGMGFTITDLEKLKWNPVLTSQIKALMKQHKWFGSMAEATAETAITAIMQAHGMEDYPDLNLKEQWSNKLLAKARGEARSMKKDGTIIWGANKQWVYKDE